MADNPSETDEALTDGDSAADTIDFASTQGPEAEAPSPGDRLAEAEDRVLRLQAELQNVINRARREVAEERRYGPLGIARDLLPAIDNIDRALQAASSADDDASGLADGFRMVREQIVAVLAQHGCEPIPTDQGVEFDPSLHEAILQQPSEEVAGGGILMATQTGYKLHDRVVRAAQVIVSSGPAE